MDTLSPTAATLLADLILLLHIAVVGFVVLGEALFLAGGWRGWSWVRHFGLRLTHLALMVFIAVQTSLGQLCPLTLWEQALRRRAGQGAFTESFIEHWLSRLLFFDAPWWVFVAAHIAFAVLVLLTWWWVPPRRRSRA